MKFMKAEDIQLPNENDRLAQGRNRLIAQKEYKKRQQTLAIIFRATLRILSDYQNENPTIIIEVHTYLDLSNVIKPVEDVLERMDLIPNDRNTFRIDASKVPLKKGQRDSIFIIIR